MKEESIFEEYFGNSPLVRVMNFLILGKDFDYSMTDIAEGSSVGWTSFKRAWKILEKNNAVSHTRDIGKAKLYKLNTENSTIKKIIKLHWEILKSETNKMLEEEIAVKV